MRTITGSGRGSSRNYQSLPGEPSDQTSNPFASSSERSSGEDTESYKSGTSGRVVSGGFDRYPQSTTRGASLLAPPAASGSSRAMSMSSVDETDPFLSTNEFSPFGGYPASEFPLKLDEKEADDYLHNPDPIVDAADERKCHKLDARGWGCLVAFLLLLAGFIVVFIVLPILDFTGPAQRTPAPNQISRLSPYTYGRLKGLRKVIDDDTPDEVKTRVSPVIGKNMSLVFSDEFNVEGRTFYSGDDPFWEAPDFWYGAATEDLEWYSPDAAWTENGTLHIRLDAYKNHNLNYRSAMIQSWNKLCYSQGYIEFGVRLGGSGETLGLWPGIWTMGNLGRPGFLASTQGVWPYSYQSCDAGITPNQSAHDGISYLPGQRLSSCTCKGEDHPSPGHGRGAPEIDVIEGTVNDKKQLDGHEIPASGVASQSLQVAPMDIWWMVDYDFIEITDLKVTQMNTWNGGPFQQAVSGTTYLNPAWYDQSKERAFQRYGLEVNNNETDGYISWYVGDKPSYTMYAGALAPNGNVDQRTISKEPMSIVMNLGISSNWVYIDYADLVFPTVQEIDYVRIYQEEGRGSLTCDPPGYETTGYIQDHIKAYLNPNLTSWSDAGYDWPKNSLMDGCQSA